MTDTSFQPSLSLIRAIDVDFRARCKAIEAAYEDEMAPLRLEFARKRAEIEARRKYALARAKTWRDSIVKRVGCEPVDPAHVDLKRRRR